MENLEEQTARWLKVLNAAKKRGVEEYKLRSQSKIAKEEAERVERLLTPGAEPSYDRFLREGGKVSMIKSINDRKSELITTLTHHGICGDELDEIVTQIGVIKKQYLAAQEEEYKEQKELLLEKERKSKQFAALHTRDFDRRGRKLVSDMTEDINQLKFEVDFVDACVMRVAENPTINVKKTAKIIANRKSEKEEIFEKKLLDLQKEWASQFAEITSRHLYDLYNPFNDDANPDL